MVTLDLHSPVQSGKVIAAVKPGMTDKEFLEQEIRKWLASPKRKAQIEGDAYYEGAQEILSRKRMVVGEDGELMEAKHLPNHRIVDNQYAKMVDQKANYLCGKPVTFDTKTEEFGRALSEVFGPKLQRLIRITAEKALAGGNAWMLPYYNSKGEFSLSVISAQDMLPMWADTEHTDLDCAVHFYPVYVYDEDGNEEIVYKAEVYHADGVERFIWEDEQLKPDTDAVSGPYVTVTDDSGKILSYNWNRLPLICFKSNHREIPLLRRVKCLQDALNLVMSNFVNCMDEDVHNTVLVLHNYDGENLGEFRRNLATFGVVKVRSFEGADGGVEKLTIEVDSDNYKIVLDLLKKAIIENARGYDAKDERLNGSPNQLNIRSMYSDIDLDANGMETEFQAAFEELLWFVRVHLSNSGKGDFMDEPVTVIFNRDILINESEAIDNCIKSEGVLSHETIVKQHPWVDDPIEELDRLESEKQKAIEQADPYRAAFESTQGQPQGGDALNE